MTEPAFDPAALSYDETFTDTQVGRLQRDLVHGFLREKIRSQAGMEILEINCGTGADAIWLAGQGVRVEATDLSGEMVEIARAKWAAHPDRPSSSGTLNFSQMDLRDLADSGRQYDLVFSNFGGLNCIPPTDFKAFIQLLPQVLRPNGYFVAVVMPRFCAWESLYFSAKFRFRQAFRRQGGGPIPAPLGDGAYQDTWYYRPSTLRAWVEDSRQSPAAPKRFQHDIRPIGFFLPPSYLDPFFHKRPSWLERLNRWEQRVATKAWYAPRSDHFLYSVQYFY